MTLKRFLIHLALMILFFTIVLYGTMCSLKQYTNHGQKLELPSYIDKHIDYAQNDADDRGFQIVINDSIHKVGIPGGQILIQNPKPNSFVKEDRKVYVTTSKYVPDNFKSEYLGRIYGSPFYMKERELRRQDIYSNIVDRKYDRGEPDMILEAYYKGKPLLSPNNKTIDNINIPKGETIDFIISTNEGGETQLPDLVCQTISAAKWQIDLSNLKINIVEEGVISDINNAYIVRQEPSLNDMINIPMGETIVVYISQEKPSTCR